MATTNALIKRIQSVRSIGDAYKNSNMLKNQKDGIERNFLPSYQLMSNKFKGVLRAYNALSKIRTVNVDFEAVILDLITLNNKTQNNEFDRQLVYTIQRELERILVDLNAIWQGYISEKTADIKSILLTLDRLIEGMPEKRILDEKSRVFTNSGIGDSAAIVAVSDYIKTYNVLMGKLDLKESVLKFLKLFAQGRTVTLDDMDEEVYAWFRSSDFSRKIMVNMRQ
jgi:hypothetical protein